jgi:hypothetical protein
MTNYLGPLVIAEGFSAKHRHRGRVPLQAGTNQQILPASLGDSEPFKRMRTGRHCPTTVQAAAGSPPNGACFSCTSKSRAVRSSRNPRRLMAAAAPAMAPPTPGG